MFMRRVKTNSMIEGSIIWVSLLDSEVLKYLFVCDVDLETGEYLKDSNFCYEVYLRSGCHIEGTSLNSHTYVLKEIKNSVVFIKSN